MSSPPDRLGTEGVGRIERIVVADQKQEKQALIPVFGVRNNGFELLSAHPRILGHAGYLTATRKPIGGFWRSLQQQLGDLSGELGEGQALAGQVVEFVGTASSWVSVTELKSGALGEVLAQEPVGVLVGPALPGGGAGRRSTRRSRRRQLYERMVSDDPSDGEGRRLLAESRARLTELQGTAPE